MNEFQPGDRAFQVSWVETFENPFVTIVEVRENLVFHTHDGDGRISAARMECFKKIEKQRNILEQIKFNSEKIYKS